VELQFASRNFNARPIAAQSSTRVDDRKGRRIGD
jgi:hypothetical protein